MCTILLVGEHIQAPDEWPQFHPFRTLQVLVAHTLERALAILTRKRPGHVDIAVVERRLPDGDGGDLAKEIRRLHPCATIAILSDDIDTDNFLPFVRQRIPVFVMPVAADGLVQLIQALIGFDPLIDFCAAHRLSRTQARVLEGAAAGLSNKEIAGLLGRSESTVKSHWLEICKRTGVRGKALVVAAATGRRRIDRS